MPKNKDCIVRSYLVMPGVWICEGDWDDVTSSHLLAAVDWRRKCISARMLAGPGVPEGVIRSDDRVHLECERYKLHQGHRQNDLSLLRVM